MEAPAESTHASASQDEVHRQHTDAPKSGSHRSPHHGHRRNRSDGDALGKIADLLPSPISPPRDLSPQHRPERPLSPRPTSPDGTVRPVIGSSRASNKGAAPTVQFVEPPPIVRATTPPLPAQSPVALPPDLPRLDDVRFDEKESESNTQYEEGSGLRLVRAWTVGKLIERLTTAEYWDEYSQMLVSTHSTWIPSTAFVSLLEMRYKATTDLRVHALVVDALKLWAEFAYDGSVLPQVQIFVKSIEGSHSTVMGSGSLALLHRTLEHAATGKGMDRRIAVLSPRTHTLPLLRRTPVAPQMCGVVEDVPTVDLARQMCMLDEALFAAVTTKELCSVAWTRINKELAAPNVMAIVARFNRLVSWVQWTVLRSEKSEGRARTIHFFIKTARCLHEMHNYAGMYALVTGLQGVAVKRLQLTWVLVKKRKSEKLQHLVDFMKLDQQCVLNLIVRLMRYAAYREHLAKLPSSVPCVPYVGPYLGQLTFVEEMPKMHHGLVSVSRLRAIHSSIHALLRFQHSPSYSFEAVGWLQAMVSEGTLFTESQLYKQSLKCEPRMSVGGGTLRK